MTAAALIALAISAEPSLIRIGRDAQAALTIESRSVPALSSSAGRVGAPRLTAEGKYAADYFPPDDGQPCVAIVAAVAGGEIAWIAIPIWGEGDAVVKTRPGGSISVDISGQTFGPVVADEHGQAVVPVVVPPGVQEARHGKRTIPIHVPPARTVHLVLGEAARRADVAQTVALYVIAVTAQGAPRSGAAIRLRSTRGRLSAVRERGAGLYEASLALTPAAAGEVRITAALEDAPRLPAEAALTLEEKPPEPIEPSPAPEPVAVLSERRPPDPVDAVASGASRNWPSIAVSAKAGFLSNFSGFSAPLAGLEAAVRSDHFGPKLALSIEVDYGRHDQSEAVATGVVGQSRTDLMLVHVSAAWRRDFSDRDLFWVAAGPSAAAYWTTVGVVGGTERRAFAMAPGFQAAFGAEHKLGLAIPFLEARAGWVASPGSPILTGPLRTFSLLAGVRLETR